MISTDNPAVHSFVFFIASEGYYITEAAMPTEALIYFDCL